VQKASRGNFPIVVSITVPLISGIRLAESSGITLVSFGQGKLKVYTRNFRIKSANEILS
jgi:formate dehydrogenase assembly factor FdhD